MSNDERPQDDSGNNPYDEADTAETRVQPDEPAAHDPAEPPAASASRWDRVSEPARRHPIGLAVGTAVAGLVIGLLGGVALNAHSMMSLQIGTAPGLASVDRQGPGGPPPGRSGDRHGPAGDRHGPSGPGRPGSERGPDGGPGGPLGPGNDSQGRGDARRPDAPPPPADDAGPTAPTPPGEADAPRPANPGADEPPLPAERGALGQTSGA